MHDQKTILRRLGWFAVDLAMGTVLVYAAITVGWVVLL